jgi:arabinofuranosyltransferase
LKIDFVFHVWDLINKKRWIRFLVWLGVIGSPLLYFYRHHRYYQPYICDDALISLRYAQRLLQGKGLTWTDGIPVEGYSNLLWILFEAGIGCLGIDLVQGVKILGFLCMSGVFFALFYAFKILFPHRSPLYLFPALSVFALSGTISIWSIGGLEQPSVALLLAWSLTFFLAILHTEKPKIQHLWLLSLCLGLLMLTRPDSPLFVLSMVLTWLSIRGLGRSSARCLLFILFFPVLFYGGQMIFRILYYSDWISNTARVKMSVSGHHMLDGLHYIGLAFIKHLPISVIGLIIFPVLFFHRKTKPAAVALITTDMIWLIYIVVIGGDIFLAFRHMVPILVVFIFGFMIGTVFIWDQIKSSGLRMGFIFFILGSLIFFHQQQFTYKNRMNTAVAYKRWQWDGRAIGLFLKQVFGYAQPLLAVDAAGALPFWSELPCLDMLGLNDYYIPRRATENFGKGFIGHELGDGRYVLERKPDLIMFAIPPGYFKTRFKGGLEMLADSLFHETYVKVHFMIEEPHEIIARFWVNKYSEKIGIQYQAHEVGIPAYLFSTKEKSAAFLNSSGNLVVSVSDTLPLFLKDIRLPQGQWKSEASTDYQVSLRSVGEHMFNIGIETQNTIPVEIQEIRLISKP